MTMIRSEHFKAHTRVNEKDFTRNRKAGFQEIILIILNKISKTMQLELDGFKTKFFTDEKKETTYTKQSFSEARQKLSPQAFTMLNDECIRDFYQDGNYKTYNGWRLLAIDGSVQEVPNNKETREVYGYVTNGEEEFKVARARSTWLHDLENDITITSKLGRYDDSERKMAKENIEKMLSLGISGTRDLILFDRGFPSADMIQFLIDKGIKFMMRVSTGFYKEVVNTLTKDEIVHIEMTKQRCRELKKKGLSFQEGSVITIRVIKVELPSGEIEILITNLTQEELPYEESSALYFRRWGLEGRFNDLKHKFEIENFSGEKKISIGQDFYATMLLSNIASLIKQDAESELDDEDNFKKTVENTSTKSIKIS
jgi:Transposase DDE domain